MYERSQFIDAGIDEINAMLDMVHRLFKSLQRKPNCCLKHHAHAADIFVHMSVGSEDNKSRRLAPLKVVDGMGDVFVAQVVKKVVKLVIVIILFCCPLR
jgi:hypothetical protein